MADKNKSSKNREESMTESSDDAFGKKGAVRNPDQTKSANNPRSSGTVGLNNEDPDSESSMKIEE
ncbi:MAG TPA: hypothetical protein VM099_14770 [Gemmatimonadaceae bacterium]|nr:hypothetical protein [Gemmatimonadaceae bacterium]